MLYHISLAPRFLLADVRLITGPRWLYALVPRLVPKRLFDRVNAWYTRFGSRRLSRQFLAREYDRAHAMALLALDRVEDGEFQTSVGYPDWDPLLSGEVTLEQLFHYVKDHFEAHASQIERLIAGEG